MAANDMIVTAVLRARPAHRRPLRTRAPLASLLLLSRIAGLLLAVILAVACGGSEGGTPASTSYASRTGAASTATGAAKSSVPAPYVVSPQGGTPASGPGARYNHCERIWCLVHGENFFIDHFLTGHDGWILHDDAAGDVYVPVGRTSGPRFPASKATALRLCGSHVHPYMIGTGPVMGGYYSLSIGFSRAHWRKFGTQLDPCCINGMGWDFVHSSGVGRFFRFHELDDYRAHPERGWQKPYTG